MSFLIRREHRPIYLFVAIAVTALAPALHGQEAEQPQGARATEGVEPPVNDVGFGAAEETGNEGEQAAAAESKALNDDSILAMIVDSGVTGMVFMGILGLFSIVAGTVAVERAVNMRRNRVLPPEFVEDLESYSQRHVDPVRLSELCARYPGPLATILNSALLRVGRPIVEVEKSMEDAAVREISELRAKIRPLNTVGSIAPLVGLLGTVVGMIIAFHTASQAGLGKAELLAKGIYMALLTTAGGLSIAIPSLLLASYFNGRLDRFFREVDRRLMQLLPALAGGPAPPDLGPTVGNGTPSSAKPRPIERGIETPIPKATTNAATSPLSKLTAETPEPRVTEPRVTEQKPSTSVDRPEKPAAVAPEKSAHRRTKNNPLMGDKA